MAKTQGDHELVSIAIEIDNIKHLHKINKTHTLEKIIEEICEKFHQPLDKTYGLQYSQSAENKHMRKYVTEENRSDIKDASFLKLVPSLPFMINFIFNNIQTEEFENDDELYENLLELSLDPAFIKELVKKKKHTLVMTMIMEKQLATKQIIPLMICIIHALQQNKNIYVDPPFVDKIINFIRSDTTPPEVLQYAVTLMYQILHIPHSPYYTTVRKQLPLSELFPLLWTEEYLDLQSSTLKLINAFVKLAEVDEKVPFIVEMNLQKNKDIIYKHVKNVTPSMAHQLHLYQTHILSLYAPKLNSTINLNGKDKIKDRLGSLDSLDDKDRDRNSRGSSILLDFEEVDSQKDQRKSKRQTNEVALRDQSKKGGGNVKRRRSGIITILTLECLVYYKQNYNRNFKISVQELDRQDPGFYVTCDQITYILCKLFNINKPPDSTAQSYCPLAFGLPPSQPFFEEMFCRTVWLMLRTKREMKATTFEDHEKVLKVLEEEINLILECHPTTLENLSQCMKNMSYSRVAEVWQRQSEKEWKHLIHNSPCVEEIREELIPQNNELIEQQRILTLQKGAKFPKLPEKKSKQQFWFAQLSKNRQMLYYGDWNDEIQRYVSDPNSLQISSIRLLVAGKACPHIKENKVRHAESTYECAFSLLLEEDGSIDFQAKDKHMADTWVDGFSILLGKPMNSEAYRKELEVLLEMDLALQMLDLQGMEVPLVAPPIPPLPPCWNEKPPIPKKPSFLTKYGGSVTEETSDV